MSVDNRRVFSTHSIFDEISIQGKEIEWYVPGRVIKVNDFLQQNYTYVLTATYGRLDELVAPNEDPVVTEYFRPDLTPKYLLDQGVFGGGYCNDCIFELPKEWLLHPTDIHLLNSLNPEKCPDPELNKFKVMADLKDSVVPIYLTETGKGVLANRSLKKDEAPCDPDIRGWFQWYMRYFLGRRLSIVDEIQKKRWILMQDMKQTIIDRVNDGIFYGSIEAGSAEERQKMLEWAMDPLFNPAVLDPITLEEIEFYSNAPTKGNLPEFKSKKKSNKEVKAKDYTYASDITDGDLQDAYGVVIRDLNKAMDPEEHIIIRLISDVHLEYTNKIPCDIFPEKLSNHKEKVKEVLVLAGDIGDPFSTIYGEFLKLAKSKFDMVIVVPGNHEYYQSNVVFKQAKPVDNMKRTIAAPKEFKELSEPKEKFYSIVEVRQKIKDVCDHHNCIMLDNDAITIQGRVRFIGSTLWCSMPKIKEAKLKHRKYGCLTWIKKSDGSSLTVDDFNTLHKDSMDAIDALLRDPETAEIPTVLITHYPPIEEVIKEEFRMSADRCCYYAPDAGHKFLGNPSIRIWLAGHVHSSVDYDIDGTRVSTNCYGNFKENDSVGFYRRNFHLTI